MQPIQDERSGQTDAEETDEVTIEVSINSKVNKTMLNGKQKAIITEILPVPYLINALKQLLVSQ